MSPEPGLAAERRAKARLRPNGCRVVCQQVRVEGRRPDGDQRQAFLRGVGLDGHVRVAERALAVG
jgi:hypothetical protein